MFPQGFTCPVVLWILPRWPRLRLRGSHPLWPAFPGPFGWLLQSLPQSGPRRARTAVWALPVPLAATPGIDVSFSSSGYLDVSVRRVPPAGLCVRPAAAGVLPRRVSPFGHPWITARVRLPMAFRSLPRPSSAPSAKASALRLSLLNPSLRAPSVAPPGPLPYRGGMLPCPPARPRGPCRACARIPARPVLPALVSFMTRAQQTAGIVSAVVLVFGIRFSRCVLPFRRPCGPLPGWA